ncbi:glycosyl hydrolase family 8 [Croceibacterium ferulae]|uniref:glycosyl hydrolase family 8 n=1 Tax=Croceibacterium ferulae TaxID=1854641 RepID=UPI0013906735|nr:glycosyl hydrolase family 8 [Croceibacterium ferulae]
MSRRLFCIGAATGVVSACIGSDSSASPPTPTPTTTPMPGGTAPVSWAGFSGRFLDQSGRVIDNGNKGVSHSEGQGYGMVMAAHAGDRQGFTRMWDWTRDTLLRPEGLLAWRYVPTATPPVADPNNATDGDILVAWALGIAGARWNRQDWLAQAAVMRAAILARVTVTLAGRRVLLPGVAGFAEGGRVTLNPAYYVWPALDAFHAVAPAEGWDTIIADGTWLLTQARFGQHQLPTDWVELAPDGALRPAPGRSPWFGFDAVRVPLYAQLGGRSGLARPAAEYWQGRRSAGQMIPAWVDVTNGAIAEYAGSAGVEAIVALTGGGTAPHALSDDYYAAVLQVLATLRP